MYSIPAVCSWLGMIFSLTLLSRSSLALPIVLARCWHTPAAYLSMAALWVEFAKGLPELCLCRYCLSFLMTVLNMPTI